MGSWESGAGSAEALPEARADRQWKVVAASVRGSSHETTGRPCQDAHDYLQRPGVLMAAVADGAGSAELAEVGARIAACCSVDALCAVERLPKTDEEWHAALRNALKAAQAALEAEAAARQTPVRDLATTLLLAAATPDCVAVLQVGDGAVVVGDRSGTLQSLTVPQTGEHLNETTFLVSPEALETAQFSLWQGEVAHLALFSDGLQMVALRMPGGVPHAPFFTPLFDFTANATVAAEAEAQLEAFLRSSRLAARTDDDRTLLLASLNEEGVGVRV